MRGPLRFRHRPRVLIVGASALVVLLPLMTQVGVGGAPVVGPPLPLMVSMAAIDPTTLAVTSELAKRLRTHVEYLAGPKLSGRKPGTPGNRAAADYIAARFGEVGLVALPSVGSYGQQISPALGDNLIGLRPGTSPDSAAPWLLIGAHYDHLGGQYLGADDNASAVAILLETARILPRLPHHHLLFVAFNAEEPPFIRTPNMGSQYFVDHLPQEIGSPSHLHTAIIMDLMGGVHWEPLRDVVFAAGSEKSPGLARRLKEMTQASGARLEARGQNLPVSPIAHSPLPLAVLPLGLHLVEEIPVIGQVSFSDYDSFRNASVPFLFLSSGRTPRYHQPSDLPDTLHYERMAATVKWLANLAERMDQDTAPYEFQANRIEFAGEVTTLRPLVAQAAKWETGIPGTSSLSHWKLEQDDKWLEGLDLTAPTPEALRRLERISIRLQCLLADFPLCFLI